jgi:sugar-specific transcriptional regulator TrmB
MDTEDLKDVLDDAGLSPYQVEAYVTVLELGSAAATEVAEASDVPDPRIYDVLRDLETEGYVETYEQDSLRVRAHDPGEVLADLRERAERYTAAAEEIEQRWNQPAMADHQVSVVKRFETVLDRARESIRTAETQVEVSVTPEQFEQLTPALATAHDAGVEVKVSVHTVPGGRSSLPETEALEGVCTEARHRPLPAPFVSLVDRTNTCFAPHADAVHEYGMLVSDHAHAFVFHWFFQTCLWEIYEPVHSTKTDGPPVQYTEMRECVRYVEPLLEKGVEIGAAVEGYDTATGETVAIHGRLVEACYGGVSTRDDERLPLAQLAGEVNVTLATADGEVTVGGWGAMMEDIEAFRITVEDVTRSNSTARRRNAQ